MCDAIDNVISKLNKKHPDNYGVRASWSHHDVLGSTIHAFVETIDEKLMYGTDKAGRLRLINRTALTATYKSVRNDPKDSAVIIRGGKYDGHYVVGFKGEGWLATTTNIKEVKPMQAYYANDYRNYINTHSQFCYRGIFEVINVSKHTN